MDHREKTHINKRNVFLYYYLLSIPYINKMAARKYKKHYTFSKFKCIINCSPRIARSIFLLMPRIRFVVKTTVFFQFIFHTENLLEVFQR